MLDELYEQKDKLVKKLIEAKKLSNLLGIEKNIYSSFSSFGYSVDDTSISKDKILSRRNYANKDKSNLDNNIIPSIQESISNINQNILSEQGRIDDTIV